MARRRFRGKTLDDTTVWRIQRAEKAAGVGTIPLYQGSYSTSIAASKGTHAGGGVVDFNVSRLTNAQVRDFLENLRREGFAAWDRALSEKWPRHIHAVEIQNPNLSPAARRQASSVSAGAGRGRAEFREPAPMRAGTGAQNGADAERRNSDCGGLFGGVQCAFTFYLPNWLMIAGGGILMLIGLALFVVFIGFAPVQKIESIAPAGSKTVVRRASGRVRSYSSERRGRAASEASEEARVLRSEDRAVARVKAMRGRQMTGDELAELEF